MRVHNKIIVLLIGIVLVMGIFFIYTRFAFDQSIAIVARERVEEEKRSFQEHWALHRRMPEMFLRVYTSWGSFVNFVRTADAQWAAEHLERKIKLFEIDNVYVYAANGSPIYQSGVMPAPVSAAELSGALAHRHTASFYSMSSMGVREVYASAVYAPDAGSPRGLLQGYVVCSRLVGREYLGVLSRMIQGVVTVRIPGAGVTDAAGAIEEKPIRGTIRFLKPLYSHTGETIAWLSVKFESHTAGIVTRLANKYLLFMACFVFLFVTAAWWMLEVMVSRPLRKLTRTLLAKDGAHAAELMGRDDEFGVLAQRVTEALSQEEQLSAESTVRRRMIEVLQEQQDTFQIVMRQTGQMVYDYVLTADKITWSGAIVEITGYTSDEFEKITLDMWTEHIHPDDKQNVVTGLFGAMKDGKKYVHEYRFRRKDGSYLDVEDSGLPLPDARGKVVRIVGVMKDITLRRGLEQQLKQAQKIETVGRLAGGIAHDFNNIMTAILNYSFFVRETLPPTAAVRQDVEEIIKSAQRAHKLTQQLLSFSRRQAVKAQDVDVNQLISSVYPMLRHIVREDIEVAVVFGAHMWQMHADPVQIEQALVNLVTNASDAVAGGGKIIVETEAAASVEPTMYASPQARAGDYVKISVKDNGVGMAPEVLAHLFEPYFTTKAVGKGSGLGLATVYGIVNQHQGFIEVVSKPGYGTTFMLYFPRLAQNSAETVCPVQAHEEAVSGGNEKILYAEDDSAVRAVVERILKKYGYCVTAVSNGSEALERARMQQGAFDMLITDVVMPQMNGKVLAGQIRMLFPRIKIIFVSGYADAIFGPGETPEQAGIFLEKPLSEKTLLRAVRSVLDGGGVEGKPQA